MFSLCLHEFSPSSPASTKSPQHACEADWELLHIGPKVRLQAVFPLQVVENGMKIYLNVSNTTLTAQFFFFLATSADTFLVCVTLFATQLSRALKNKAKNEKNKSKNTDDNNSIVVCNCITVAYNMLVEGL